MHKRGDYLDGEKAKMNNSIGNKIIESMTQRQVASLLSSLFGLLDDRKIKHLLTVVDKEIADILCQILDPNKKSSGFPSTDSKCLEDWRELWDKWYELTSELADEDGRDMYFKSITGKLRNLMDMNFPMILKEFQKTCFLLSTEYTV